jgi:hypothetical protein
MYVVSVAKDAKTLYLIAAPLGLATGSSQPAMSGLFLQDLFAGAEFRDQCRHECHGHGQRPRHVRCGGLPRNAYGYRDIYTGSFLLPLAALVIYFLHVLQLKRRTERRLEQRKAV